MPILRHLPLRYRLPLINGVLEVLARVRAFGWKKADILPPAGRGTLVVSGFLNEALGIGRAGRMTADALRAAGYDIVTHDLRPGFRHLAKSDLTLPGEGGVWLIHANAPEDVIAMLANRPASWNERYRIAYWAWETGKVPAEWLFAAEYLHEIWVPSRYVRDALIRTMKMKRRRDMAVRVRLMPHPVPVLPPKDKAKAKFGLDPNRCEVLCLFDTKSSAARKNPWGVIDAWRLAFPESGAARLTLKVVDLMSDRVTEQKLNALLAERHDVRLIDERFDDRDMDDFIAAFDILISLHRSEGFGLTLAEAMAAGVAVIATAGSGNDDFMTADDARLIPAAEVRVRDADGPYGWLEGDPEQTWGEPDIAAAAEALRELAASKAARDALAKAGPDAVRPLSEPWRREALAALPFNAYL